MEKQEPIWVGKDRHTGIIAAGTRWINNLFEQIFFYDRQGFRIPKRVFSDKNVLDVGPGQAYELFHLRKLLDRDNSSRTNNGLPPNLTVVDPAPSKNTIAFPKHYSRTELFSDSLQGYLQGNHVAPGLVVALNAFIAEMKVEGSPSLMPPDAIDEVVKGFTLQINDPLINALLNLTGQVTRKGGHALITTYSDLEAKIFEEKIVEAGLRFNHIETNLHSEWYPNPTGIYDLRFWGKVFPNKHVYMFGP